MTSKNRYIIKYGYFFISNIDSETVSWFKEYFIFDRGLNKFVTSEGNIMNMIHRHPPHNSLKILEVSFKAIKMCIDIDDLNNKNDVYEESLEEVLTSI